MDLQERINQLKTKTLRKIEDAAKRGDTSSVVLYSRIIEEIGNSERKLDQLVSSLNSIEKTAEQDGKDLYLFDITNATTLKDKSISPKKRGENIRGSFLKRAQELGIDISQVKGVQYKVHDRSLIGIAYAFENKQNRWFLGLPKENFDAIVLLCESKNGEILSFIFSKDFYYKIKDYLSTDEYGQLKYNIALRNSNYQLMIPQMGNENVNSFRDNFNNLKQL